MYPQLKNKYLDPKDLQTVFKYWNDLSLERQTHLLQEIFAIDEKVLQNQKKLILSSSSHTLLSFEPVQKIAKKGNLTDFLTGKRLIKEGKVGCIILAGGQGSRLNFEKPKGMFPISVIQNKSLFQICAEKVAAASKQAQRQLSLAIMTSPLNDQETKDFFKANAFFGLAENQVFFFCQSMLPLLNKEGHLFLESPDQIAMGPNGNGFCLHEFVKAGIWAKWNQQGIEYVNMIQIDNPLADPFDAELIGFQEREQLEIASITIEKNSPNEKVGVFVLESTKSRTESAIRVVEYSELGEDEKEAKWSNGQLKYGLASLSLFSFKMDFIKNVSSKSMPLHLAWKAVKCLEDENHIQIFTQSNAWKFEAFIFDVLVYAKKVGIILYPRDECFAPLKNLNGENSPKFVKEAILKRERQIMEEITSLKSPSSSFELDAQFYYPTEELLQKWKNKIVPNGYIPS